MSTSVTIHLRPDDLTTNVSCRVSHALNRSTSYLSIDMPGLDLTIFAPGRHGNPTEMIDRLRLDLIAALTTARFEP